MERLVYKPSCGCEVLRIMRSKPNLYRIQYCPKHKAAEAMYEALGAVDDYLSAPYPENMKLKQIAADKLVSALALAKGKV